MNKVTWEELVEVMARHGWSVEDVEDERSRQFYAELERNPPPPAVFTPGTFIHDEGSEDFNDDEGSEPEGEV